MLGDNFDVRNFGIGGATLIKTGRPNVWRNLESVEQFQPHFAVISQGTNDTVGGERKIWEQVARFENDYAELIKSLSDLATKPAETFFIRHDRKLNGAAQRVRRSNEQYAQKFSSHLTSARNSSPKLAGRTKSPTGCRCIVIW